MLRFLFARKITTMNKEQPTSKDLLLAEIRWIAEQWKTKGKPLTEALVAARKENTRFEQNGCTPLPDGEVITIVNEVYGAAQRAVISSSREFAVKEFKESEVMLQVTATGSSVLHHPSLGELHASRGVGKTNFGIGLFDALATGGEFLCYKATRPFKTIYFDGEMDASDLQQALSLLAEENDNFTLVARCEQPDNFMPSIATAEGLAWCEEAIIRSGAEVAIFDNWSTLANVGTNEEEAFFEFSAWCRKMRLRGVTIIYDHHDGKSGTQRGHTKPEDTLNWVIGLRWQGDYKGQEGLRCVMEFDKCRKPVREYNRISISLGEDGTWLWGEVGEEQQHTTGRRAKQPTSEQLTMLRDLVGKVSERELAKQLGVSREVVKKWSYDALMKDRLKLDFDESQGATNGTTDIQ
jgi:hypothetical protein